MADKERYTTRMFNPGNPMQFTKSAQAPQANHQASNQRAQMAKQLLSFSDSFVGAMKAKFEHDDRQEARQEKIADQIKKEYTTEQELLGRTERRRNNLLRPEQREILLSPEARRGWRLQDYEFKRDTRNKYLATHSKKMATSIFNAYNVEKKAGNIKYTSLEKFASSFIEARRSAFIDSDFSIRSQEEGEEPIFTVTKEAQEVLAKKGIDFTGVFEEVANLSVKQQATTNRAVKQRQVQTIVRGTRPPITYAEFKSRIFKAQINLDERAYFTEAEIINEYIRDIKEQLRFAKTSDDPVFRSLEFLDTDKEGVSLLNNGYLTENKRDGVSTIGDEVSVLYKKLRDEKTRLEAEEFSKSKDHLEKAKEDKQVVASDNSRQYITLINNAENPHALKVIKDRWELSRGLYDANTTNDTQFGWGKVEELFALKEKSFKGQQYSTTIKNTDDAKPFQELLNKLRTYQTNSDKSQKLNLETLKNLEAGFVPYFKYTEVKEAQTVLKELREKVEQREDDEIAEADQIAETDHEDAKKQAVSSLTDEVRILEQNPDRTSKDIDQLLTRINEELAPYAGTKEAGILKNRISTLATLNAKENKTEIYEENGIIATTGADRILDAVNAGDVSITPEHIDRAIELLNTNNTILLKDRRTAIKALFDAKAKLAGKDKDAGLIKLRQRLSKITENQDELEKFIAGDSHAGYPDVVKEAQSHLNNLNNRAATQEFYWKTWDARVELNDARTQARYTREKERKTEERTYRELEKKRDREYNLTVSWLKKKDSRNYRELEKKRDREYDLTVKWLTTKDSREYKELRDKEKREVHENFLREMYELRKKDRREDVKNAREFRLSYDQWKREFGLSYDQWKRLDKREYNKEYQKSRETQKREAYESFVKEMYELRRKDKREDTEEQRKFTLTYDQWKRMDKRQYEQWWTNLKTTRREAHAEKMRKKRIQDRLELRKQFKIEDDKNLSAKLKKERAAFAKASELMSSYIAATSDEKRALVIKEFSSEDVQNIFNSAPNNSAYNSLNTFFLDQTTKKIKNDRSIQNRRLSDQSKETRKTEAGKLVGKIDSILESEAPDFDEARSLLMERTVIQEYYSDDGRVEIIDVDTLPLNKRIEYSSKIKARRLEHQDKEANIKESNTTIEVHLKLEKLLRTFPFELAENDTTGKSVEEKQSAFIADFWKQLSSAYTSRKISQSTFNQLDRDLKLIQSDAKEREWFMAKTAPFNPIKTWEAKLRDEVANPRGFYIEVEGAGILLAAEENRKQLESDILTDYRTYVNRYFRENPEWIKKIDAQEIKCKEIHDLILEKYQKRIDKVNDQLGIGLDPTDDNLSKGNESPLSLTEQENILLDQILKD